MRFHGHTKAPYLAMVLSFVLQHLLQIHATGQITLSQVVAELGDAEQTLLRAHCLTMIKQEHTRTHGKKKKFNTCDGHRSVFEAVQAVLMLAKVQVRISCLRNDDGGRQMHTSEHKHNTLNEAGSLKLIIITECCVTNGS